MRINAGGAAQTVGSTTWQACSGAGACSGMVSGGFAYSENDTNTGIPEGMNNAIFQSEWTGGNSQSAGATAFSFSIPVSNGAYEVRLHFAELNKNGPNLRRFDVQLEGITVLSDYDIFAEVGQNVATMEAFPVTITDGVVSLAFIKRIENPKISAIEIVPATPPPGATTTRTITYDYDGLLRLIDASYSTGETYGYGYDLAGNRTSVTLNGALVQSRAYTNTNQVIGWEYDAAGNLTYDGTTISTYDALNRLISQGGASYAYNGDGVLVAQTSGGSTTTYAQDLVAPLSQVLETNGVPIFYGHERLALPTSTTLIWFLHDGLGSVRQTLDGSGGAPNSVSYDPWGTPQGGLPLTLSGMGFGFTGELQNSASGMVHLRARWYDANAGRFHARDPFEGWAETPYSQHFYQYAYSNPVNWTDPSGRCTEGWEASCNEPIEWEPITWDEFVGSSSTVIDVTPGVGDVKGLIEVFTGCDIITGEDIGHWRWLGLFGVSELRLLRQAKTTDEFYIPRAIRTELEKRYPGQVSSTTIPPTNDRMMHMAGKRHPSGIVFDHRGFPVFDDVAAYDTKIPHHIATIRDRTAHMQAATRDLHRTIMGGNLNYSFTPVQLQQIARGEARIEGFIWHHHQDRGRMQLVPRNIHQRTGHLGGFELWFGR